MPSTFSRTMRSLAADSPRRPVALLALGAALFAGWGGWFAFGRVAVYELTPSARLEVGPAVHHVEATAAGRVVASRLVLGREVRAGDVLVELDVETERLQLGEQRARLAAIEPQVAALRRETEAELRSQAERRDASRAAVREAQARHREALVLAEAGDDEATRNERMRALGHVAEVDAVRARAEARRRRAAAEALALAVVRLERDQRSDEAERAARVARLQSEVARLEGERSTLAAAVASYEHQITRRAVRAPVAGRVGRVADLRVGSVVREGDRLADLVPPGDVRVVAHYPASAALGRIRPGQPARVRLAGFPWAQYGLLHARVATVGSEAQEGRVRVELDVRRDRRTAIPLQHGLQGSVEVEVERLSPASLVLRAAGRAVSGTPQDAPGA